MATSTSEAAIWERLIHQGRPMTRKTAQSVIKLEFSPEDRARMSELAEFNRQGKLSPVEEEELDNFCRVGTMLSLLKSRARQVLKSKRPTASP